MIEARFTISPLFFCCLMVFLGGLLLSLGVLIVSPFSYSLIPYVISVSFIGMFYWFFYPCFLYFILCVSLFWSVVLVRRMISIWCLHCMLSLLSHPANSHILYFFCFSCLLCYLMTCCTCCINDLDILNNLFSVFVIYSFDFGPCFLHSPPMLFIGSSWIESSRGKSKAVSLSKVGNFNIVVLWYVILSYAGSWVDFIRTGR